MACLRNKDLVDYQQRRYWARQHRRMENQSERRHTPTPVPLPPHLQQTFTFLSSWTNPTTGCIDHFFHGEDGLRIMVHEAHRGFLNIHSPGFPNPHNRGVTYFRTQWPSNFLRPSHDA